MRDFYPILRKIILACCLLLATSGFSQLSNFELSATVQHETCTGNGVLQFSVSGTTPGASMVYSLYLLPNTTTPITVTTANQFTGLTAGTYQIVATQSLNGNTGSQQITVVVQNHVENLVYEVGQTLNDCGVSANINVLVDQGNPVSYEILQGPQTFGPQASPSFLVLQGGTYVIRVTDECGEALVQTYVFSFTPGSSLAFTANATTEPVACNMVVLSQNFTTTGIFSYPLQVTFTLTPSNAPQVTSSFEVTTGGPNSVTLAQNVFLSDGDMYSYVLSVTDACGNTFSDDGEISYDFQEPIATPGQNHCDSVDYTLYYATEGTVISAPSTYPFSLPHVLTMAEIPNTFPMPNLLPGDYTVLAIDTCGNPHEIDFTVLPPTIAPPNHSLQLGCEEGMASIIVRAFQGIGEVEITVAPSTYPFALPQDVSAFLDSVGALRMANLPAGDYVFHIVDGCGHEWDYPITIDGLFFDSNVVIAEHCGTFDLNLEYADNSSGQISFWLQKWYEASNSWGHPSTGVLYAAGNIPGITNAYQIEIGANLNLPFSGKFRLFSYRPMFALTAEERICLNVLAEFDALGPPEIVDAYSFSCNGANFDVIIDAQGMEPLKYRITTLDGNAFVVENGTSNVFTGLAPGVYNFQVEDVCHNIVNRVFEISESYSMQITANGLCEGQPVTMSVPDYPFLNYSWYQSDSGQVLSTTGTLVIPDYSAADMGTYHVHIFTDNPESCIDITLDHTLNAITPLAQAGLDSAESYCGNPGTVSLDAFLNGNVQPGGTWSETTNSGTLNAGDWDASAVSAGTYVFVYTQTSVCGPNDISVHTFTINEAPQNPVAFLEQDVCQQGDLNLLSTTIAGANYQWTGPNGFTSTEQNPVILNATSANSGTYTVQAFIGDCASEVATLNVTLAELPAFTLANQCQNDRMMLSATSASADTFYYQWSGPDGFASDQNPTDISGNPAGQYSLTVTNQAGCSSMYQQEVSATLCRVPQGISANSDGANDSWDLSGFGDDLKVKIFNRYGMVVYEMDNYVDQWHGQCKNGSMLPSATYYYYIVGATGEEKTGWVYLLRD